MISLTKAKTLHQHGDTIVEVLIAIAVVGSVLTGAFAISNRSLQQVQMAQEQTEAQKLASSSVEKLDGFVVDNPNYLSGSPSPSEFCIGINAEGKYTALNANTPDTCNTGRYLTTIEKTNDNNFTVSVTWDGLNGNEQNSIFTYRVKTPEGTP